MMSPPPVTGASVPTGSWTRRDFLQWLGLAAGAACQAGPALWAESGSPTPASTATQGTGRKTFYVVPHSHIDAEWYWTFATTREWTADILGKALALLKKDADFRFTQDQVLLIKSYWDDLPPEEQSVFRRMVKEGRLALVGGMYVQPEVAEPHGESLIRQILVGQQWLQATFGVRTRCGWFIDTFGQIPQIPQILRRAGYRYNVFWRDVPPDYPIERLPADFLWRSPDGSILLTHRLPDGYSTSDSQIRAALEQSRTDAVLLPYGSDVSRPDRDSAGTRQDLAARLGRLGEAEPRLCLATAPDYLEAVGQHARELPVIDLDFNPPQREADLRGTYDNRIELKKANRAAEHALRQAETLATFAGIIGHAYPRAEFQELWEKLLFTQFHDTIGGSHHDRVYERALERLQGVDEQASRLAEVSLRRLAPSTVGRWFIAYNPVSFARDERCRLWVPAADTSAHPRLRDDRGKTIPYRTLALPAPAEAATGRWIEFVAEDVPATGWRAYRFDAGPPPSKDRRAKAGADFLENDRFRLAWDRRTGDLIQLRDKALGHEFLAGPSNLLVVAREKDPDLEGMLHLTGEESRSADLPATSIETAEDPVALRLRVATRFPDFTLEREIALYHRLERIDFRTVVRDFAGGDVLLKVAFAPALGWDRIERVYETPLASTPRPEGHFAAQTWVDCADGGFGLALLNQGTPGYWIGNRKLELVLLRSAAHYAGYQHSGRKHGVPGYENSTQTELAREWGTHEFNYALVPHRRGWRFGGLPQAGLSFNAPFVTLAGMGEEAKRWAGRSQISAGPDFVLTAIKPAESGQGVVIRGYETRGEAHTVKLRLPEHVKHVYRASLLEEPEGPVSMASQTVRLNCAPHEIVTLLLRA